MLFGWFLRFFAKTQGYSARHGRNAGLNERFAPVLSAERRTRSVNGTIAVLSAEEEKEFEDAVVKGFCPECGKAVYQKPRGRRKKFCSDACRLNWKNKHPKPENWKSTRTAVCPVCGKEFLASREYKSKRKYCSHACVNRGRAMDQRAAAEKEGSHESD